MRAVVARMQRQFPDDVGPNILACRSAWWSGAQDEALACAARMLAEHAGDVLTVQRKICWLGLGSNGRYCRGPAVLRSIRCGRRQRRCEPRHRTATGPCGDAPRCHPGGPGIAGPRSVDRRLGHGRLPVPRRLARRSTRPLLALRHGRPRDRRLESTSRRHVRLRADDPAAASARRIRTGSEDAARAARLHVGGDRARRTIRHAATVARTGAHARGSH